MRFSDIVVREKKKSIRFKTLFLLTSYDISNSTTYIRQMIVVAELQNYSRLSYSNLSGIDFIRY